MILSYHIILLIVKNPFDSLSLNWASGYTDKSWALLITKTQALKQFADVTLYYNKRFF